MCNTTLGLGISPEKGVVSCWNTFAVGVVHLTIFFILLYLPFGLNLCNSDPCSSILTKSPIVTVVDFVVVSTSLMVIIFVTAFPV